MSFVETLDFATISRIAHPVVFIVDLSYKAEASASFDGEPVWNETPKGEDESWITYPDDWQEALLKKEARKKIFKLISVTVDIDLSL